MSTKEAQTQELISALEHERQINLQLKTELISVKQSQHEFISLVAHELRIPMTAIQGYTDLLIKAVMGPVNDTQLTFLQTIRSNVERMSRLVADLSDVNKITGDRLQLKLKVVVLKTVINDALVDVQSKLGKKNLTLTTTVPENLPSLWCDDDRLRQVLVNLLRNAVQYTPNGGKIEVNANVNPEIPDFVQVQVSDSGIGIPADQQDHVFEQFFRASDDETRQTSGNGLALHLSKLLLEMQNGTITFSSTQGKGSTFSISLPITKS